MHLSMQPSITPSFPPDIFLIAPRYGISSADGAAAHRQHLTVSKHELRRLLLQQHLLDGFSWRLQLCFSYSMSDLHECPLFCEYCAKGTKSNGPKNPVITL